MSWSSGGGGNNAHKKDPIPSFLVQPNSAPKQPQGEAPQSAYAPQPHQQPPAQQQTQYYSATQPTPTDDNWGEKKRMVNIKLTRGSFSFIILMTFMWSLGVFFAGYMAHAMQKPHTAQSRAPKVAASTIKETTEPAAQPPQKERPQQQPQQLQPRSVRPVPAPRPMQSQAPRRPQQYSLQPPRQRFRRAPQRPYNDAQEEFWDKPVDVVD